MNSKTAALSVDHKRSPANWLEPGQTGELDEHMLVLNGVLRVIHKNGVLGVGAGQAAVTHCGEWVPYSTPEGADYISVCLRAFSPDAVHRE